MLGINSPELSFSTWKSRRHGGYFVKGGGKKIAVVMRPPSPMVLWSLEVLRFLL